MRTKSIFCLALLIGMLFLCGTAFAQTGTASGPPTTTTYPSSAPSNAAGTKNVPLYSTANGALYVDFLDAPTFVLGAGSAVIGGVTQSGTWTVGLSGTPTFTIGNSSLAVTGTFWQATQPVSGTVTVGNSSIATTGTYWPYSLGQQLAASSVPVVLTASQLSALMPPTTVAATQSGAWSLSLSGTPSVGVNNFPSSQAVTGTFWPYSLGQQVSSSSVPVVLPSAQITALTPPTTVTVQQPSGSNLHVNVDSAPASLSTSSNQTNGSQKTQIVDGSGNVIGSTSNALNVDVVAGGSSGAVTQGSTTSGQSGILTQGAVTTSSPSYTTGQTSPISLTTAGAIRTDSSATIQPVSGTVTATISGTPTVTANAGTNLNTSALALETGGNLAGAKSDLDTIKTTGIPVTSLPSISGTVTANAGTNLNTSALALETGGNLAGAKSDLDTIKTTGIPVTSLPSISGTVTVNAGTNTSTAGLSTSANQTTELSYLSALATATGQTTGNTSLASILTDIALLSGTVSTSGSSAPVTNVQLGGSNQGTNTTIQSDSSGNLETNPIVQWITQPQTTFNLTTAGTSIAVQAVPGALLAFTSQIQNASQAYTSTASVTATNGSTSYTTSTSVSTVLVGELAAGTDIPYGAVVTSVTTGSPNTITLSMPASGSGTVTMYTTGGAFAVTPQYTTNGSTWTALAVTPDSNPGNNATTSSIVTPGIFLVTVPSNAWTGGQNIRLYLSSITNITNGVNLWISPFQTGQDIPMGYFSANGSGQIFTQQFAPIVPINTSNVSSISVDLAIGGTAPGFFGYQTNDPTLNTVQTSFMTIGGPEPTISSLGYLITATSNNEYRFNPNAGYWFGRTDATSWASPDFTVYGAYARLGTQITETVNASVTNTPNVDVATLGASHTPITNQSAGSTNYALGVAVTSGPVNTDVNAASVTSLTYNSGTITDATGGGPSTSANISTTWTTLGSATGLQYQLWQSLDNGTTYIETWSSPFYVATAAAQVITQQMPPVVVLGRREWRTLWLGNTAATTATSTVISNNLACSTRPYHAYYDVTPPLLSGTTSSYTSCTTTAGSTSVTGANLTTANGVWIGENVTGTGIPSGDYITAFTSGTSITLFAPATASGTVTLTGQSISAPYYIGGCGNIRCTVTDGAVTTTAGTYQIAVSDAPTGPWSLVGTATLAVANKSVTFGVTGYPAQYAEVQETSAASGQTGVSVALSAN